MATCKPGREAPQKRRLLTSCSQASSFQNSETVISVVAASQFAVIGYGSLRKLIHEHFRWLYFSLYFLFPLWSTAPHSPTFLFSLSSYSSSSLFYFCYAFVKGLSYSWDSKESTCNTGIPGSGRSPDLHAFLRRARQRTLVFLPGESHRQRSLAGYGPWVRKESDMTEWLTILSIVCNGPKELRFLSLNLKY